MAIRFGVIFIVDFLRAINDKNKQLRSILERKKKCIVEVPREELDLENVDKLVECIMRSPYISYSSYLR
ncbi:hypothetical protein E5L35_03215 [Helicobacter pylori]|nr:hypothetical protein E5L35_03215 [Helicobacter pylori]